MHMHPQTPNNIRQNETMDMPNSTTKQSSIARARAPSRPRPYDTSSQGCNGTGTRSRPTTSVPARSCRQSGRSVRAHGHATDRRAAPRTQQGTVVRNHADRAEPVARWSAYQVPRHRTLPVTCARGGCRRAFARSFARDAASQRHGGGGGRGRGRGVTATRSLRLDVATERAGSEDACVRCAASADGGARGAFWRDQGQAQAQQPTNQPAPYGGGPWGCQGVRSVLVGSASVLASGQPRGRQGVRGATRASVPAC
jgi:hypothetical protein